MTLHIRPATLDDAKLLMDWRNDPETCRASVSQDPVEWNGHVGWLTRRLERTDPQLFVAEIEGTPAATYRIDDGQLSYTVAPTFRRQGIASHLLKQIRERHGALTAEVKPHNVASIKVAERAGHSVVMI